MTFAKGTVIALYKHLDLLLVIVWRVLFCVCFGTHCTCYIQIRSGILIHTCFYCVMIDHRFLWAQRCCLLIMLTQGFFFVKCRFKLYFEWSLIKSGFTQVCQSNLMFMSLVLSAVDEWQLNDWWFNTLPPEGPESTDPAWARNLYALRFLQIPWIV